MPIQLTGCEPVHDGATPLIMASWRGNAEAALIHLECGANVNATDNNGYTALILVALIDWFDSTYTSDREQLAEAMSDVVKELVAAGADVNATNNFGETALLGAIKVRVIEQIAIVKTLIDAGANANAKDKNGKTAPMYARENGHSEIADMLIEAGAEE